VDVPVVGCGYGMEVAVVGTWRRWVDPVETEYWRGFGKGLTKAISLLHMGRNESF
jgi:hypothetical protein